MQKEIGIEPRILKKGKIHLTIIKRVALQLNDEPEAEYDKTYTQMVEHAGTRYFVAFSYLRDNKVWIREIKISKK